MSTALERFNEICSESALVLGVIAVFAGIFSVLHDAHPYAIACFVWVGYFSFQFGKREGSRYALSAMLKALQQPRSEVDKAEAPTNDGRGV